MGHHGCLLNVFHLLIFEAAENVRGLQEAQLVRRRVGPPLTGRAGIAGAADPEEAAHYRRGPFIVARMASSNCAGDGLPNDIFLPLRINVGEARTRCAYTPPGSPVLKTCTSTSGNRLRT